MNVFCWKSVQHKGKLYHVFIVKPIEASAKAILEIVFQNLYPKELQHIHSKNDYWQFSTLTDSRIWIDTILQRWSYSDPDFNLNQFFQSFRDQDRVDELIFSHTNRIDDYYSRSPHIFKNSGWRLFNINQSHFYWDSTGKCLEDYFRYGYGLHRSGEQGCDIEGCHHNYLKKQVLLESIIGIETLDQITYFGTRPLSFFVQDAENPGSIPISYRGFLYKHPSHCLKDVKNLPNKLEIKNRYALDKQNLNFIGEFIQYFGSEYLSALIKNLGFNPFECVLNESKKQENMADFLYRNVSEWFSSEGEHSLFCFQNHTKQEFTVLITRTVGFFTEFFEQE